ncbi:MAG: alkaline phosphatase family protein [Phycisphaerales bacterium]|nr:MAG: alkaline phosphatase family protein [Phycisphaerales bacterium]
MLLRTRSLPGLMAVLAGLAAQTGCTHDRPLDVTLDQHVRLPERAAVLFIVDGLDPARMDELLALGELPNIQNRLIARGTVVDHAVTCLPSITYAGLTTILTGQLPGTHGILGNKWFDRARLRVHDYATTKTYRNVDQHFRVPTVYEYLEDELTVSIQCAVRRGATRIIDNWATSGINWYFQGFDEVNKLIAIRFELIAQVANEIGRWPLFVNAYFPGLDEIGHRYGADSQQYHHSMINVDTQIGRILDAYEQIGLIDRTCFALVSDHGHVPIDPQRRLDLEKWLTLRAGLRAWTSPIPGDSFEKRYLFMKPYDAVLVNGGNRRAHLHLRSTAGWHQRPTAEEVIAVLERAGGLYNQVSVALIAVRRDDNSVLVLSGKGRAIVTRARHDTTSGAIYALDVLEGDPLGYASDPTVRHSLEAGALSSREWLSLTAQTDYPDFVPQIVEMFNSPHAGEAVIFAGPGASFSRTNRGGHGSALARDMRVPMIWRAPGIPAGARIQHARTVDVMPTVLEYLGRPLSPAESKRADGLSLTDRLSAATTNRS